MGDQNSHFAFGAYYESVPKGSWTVEYTARLNNEGDFILLKTRVEALYALEMFSMMPNKKMDIGK